ncbi:MAG: hypothetical protein KDA44_01915 [Planctomycetales bacterium]|nr:hypothetical protein [Planctomycetales bacterium]
MTLRNTVKALLGTALGAPVMIAVLVWVRVLLGAMGDEAGKAAVDRISLAIGVAWLAAVVGLVVALASVYLSATPEDDGESTETAEATAPRKGASRAGKPS